MRFLLASKILSLNDLKEEPHICAGEVKTWLLNGVEGCMENSASFSSWSPNQIPKLCSLFL